MAREVTPAAALPERWQALKGMLDLETTEQDRGSLNEWIQGRLVKLHEATSAADINAIVEDSGLSRSKDLVGRTFEIQDFAISESAEAYREHSYLQKYAIVKAVDTTTGETVMIDGGGDMWVMQLVSMRDIYGFPFTGTILGRPTGGGYEMLHWHMQEPKRQ